MSFLVIGELGLLWRRVIFLVVILVSWCIGGVWVSSVVYMWKGLVVLSIVVVIFEKFVVCSLVF